jgi:NADPH:quinone reductase-like Zn-dependent oxidoreductase
MSSELDPQTDPSQPMVYQIRLKGHLGRQWTDWFDGLTITLEDNGDTLLTGPVIDQAALQGLLKKVRDLGIPLLSVNRVEPRQADVSDIKQTALTESKQLRKLMKAIVYTKLGPPEVLQLKEVAKPVPKDNEVLVKVQAASVNALDWRRFTSQLKDTNIPISVRLMDGALLKATNTVLGADIAGRVEAIGATVKQFQPGDEVFGGSAGFLGGFAEYACAAEDSLALKPANLSFEAAAAVPVAALTALEGLRDKGQIQPGQKVLINGASGGVGTFAVQIAKSFRAEVTAVCSTRNLDMACSIGADHAIDYTQEDFTQNGQRYDLILAVNGYHPILNYRKALSPKGILVVAGGSMNQIFQALLLGPLVSRIGSKKMGFMGIAKINQKDLVFMGELLEAGKVVPVIDRCYPLSEVTEAIRYLAEGHAQGKVVITMG